MFNVGVLRVAPYRCLQTFLPVSGISTGYVGKQGLFYDQANLRPH